MRTPGEDEAVARAAAPGRGGRSATATSPGDTPRARSLRAGRAGIPAGGKAAARLATFLQQRALAFDPSDRTKAYAGTGEGNSLDVPGQGLLRSTDGGTTWSLAAAPTFAGTFFYRLVVDPLDGRRLFAATVHGLFGSTDAGANWTQLRKRVCWDVSLASTPNQPGELLAAFDDGLCRSTNAGASWQKPALPGGPADFV